MCDRQFKNCLLWLSISGKQKVILRKENSRIKVNIREYWKITIEDKNKLVFLCSFFFGDPVCQIQKAPVSVKDDQNELLI